MTEKKRIDKIFSHDNLPPLFGEKFSDGNHDWKRLSGIEFEKIGRILTCHLLIEHHVNKLLELRTPADFDWPKSKLTFSQKLKLIRKDHAFQEFQFAKGVEVINKIRNKYSHTLEVTIEKKDVNLLNDITVAFQKKHKNKDDEEYEHSDLAIIESFTSLFCAYFAGYCYSLIKQNHKFASILKASGNKTAHNKNIAASKDGQ